MSNAELTLTRRSVVGGLAAAPFALAAKSAPSGVYDAAVVGAGVFGAWTAWKLAMSGLKVVLIDAYGPANSRASSGGESRVTRIAYGESEIYSRWAQTAMQDWRALSEEQEIPVFHRTGVLWFSSARDDYIDASLRTLKTLDVAAATMDQATLAGQYPQIDFSGVSIGFLEKDSGALMARRGVQALVRKSIDQGVDYIIGKAGPPVQLDGKVRIPLDGGRKLEAAKAVYACGPWLPKVFPDIIGRRIIPTRQEVFYFGTKAGDTRFSPPALPVWADFNDGDIFYGLPDLESRGFKIAHDAHGPTVDPDKLDRQISEKSLERVRDYMARRFPGLANAPLLESRVCQYENTSSGDFLIDRHPTMENVWLVGGGSGHGFKHGPSLGAYVAARVLDDTLTVDARFRLASKKSEPARAVH